jgi:transposase-like protein
MYTINRPADGKHVVQQGEWVSKIAAQYGIADWRQVWDHPKNSDLRQNRQEPNVLFKGDLLFIPELEMRQEECSTDNKHTFILKTSKKKLKLALRDWEDKPRKGISCVLEINGPFSGQSATTDQQGKLEFEIPEDVSGARLLVGQNRSEVYEVLVGHLDPIDEVHGYQQRLSNLGYHLGEIDGIDGPLTKSAVRSFQDRENFLAGTEVLKVDGIMGPKTKDRLQQRHGY